MSGYHGVFSYCDHYGHTADFCSLRPLKEKKAAWNKNVLEGVFNKGGRAAKIVDSANQVVATTAQDVSKGSLTNVALIEKVVIEKVTIPAPVVSHTKAAKKGGIAEEEEREEGEWSVPHRKKTALFRILPLIRELL